jgi:23S rRNA (guanosine2251-2'-O)-methyltransferase
MLTFGTHAVTARLKTGVSSGVLWVDKGRRDAKISACIKMAKRLGIKVELALKSELNSLANGNHQGLILDEGQSSNRAAGLGNIVDFVDNLHHPALLLVLDGVTDPHNLGACLRVADGAGVDAVIAPKDKSAKINPTVRKVAAGAAESVPLFTVTNLARTLRDLADSGVWLIGTDDKAEDSIYDADCKGAVAFVLGNEGSGIRRLTKETCQQLVHIPMLGKVSSLNVSVASGVVLYEAVRQRL